MQYPLGFPGRGRQTTVGSPSTTVVFYFGGYFFRNFRDKASIYYMAIWDPLRLVIDCKMNDLEWPWVAMTQGHSRSLRLNSVFVPTFLDSEGWLSKIIARIVINMVYSQRQKCRPISLHGNLQQHRAVLRAIARLFCYVKPSILAPQHRPLYTLYVRQACCPEIALWVELGTKGHSRSSLLVSPEIQNGVSS